MIFYLLNTLKILYICVLDFVVWGKVKLLAPSLAVCKAFVHQYPSDKARPACALWVTSSTSTAPVGECVLGFLHAAEVPCAHWYQVNHRVALRTYRILSFHIFQ